MLIYLAFWVTIRLLFLLILVRFLNSPFLTRRTEFGANKTLQPGFGSAGSSYPRWISPSDSQSDTFLGGSRFICFSELFSGYQNSSTEKHETVVRPFLGLKSTPISYKPKHTHCIHLECCASYFCGANTWDGLP